MTYIQEIQTIEAAGVPYTEYRTEPEIDEDVIITIEFTPQQQSWDSEYQYSQPQFIFGDMVATKQQWEHCQTNHLPDTELDLFRICAMELVDSLTPNGELLSQPYWKYGIRCLSGTKELIWFEEQALIRIQPYNPDWF